MTEPEIVPRVTAHARLRFIERVLGLEDDSRRIRRALAAEKGVAPAKIEDFHVVGALAKEIGFKPFKIDQEILTPGVRKAIEAGAASVTIGGVRFAVNPSGSIATAYEDAGRFKSRHVSNHRGKHMNRKV